MAPARMRLRLPRPFLPAPFLAALLAAAFAALPLAGCFLPDRFEAELSVDASGEMRFDYKGDLVYLLGALEIAEGRMGKDDAELKRLAKSIGAARGTRDVTRDGPRYAVELRLRQVLKPGERFAFPPVGLPVFTLARGEDGTFTLRGVTASQDHLRALERLAIRFRGTLTAKLPGKAVDHNGTADRGLFSDTYKWSFNSLRDPPPYLVTRTGK